MAQWLNESVYKAVEEARAHKMHQKIVEEVTAKLSAQFSNEWAQKEAVLKKEIDVGGRLFSEQGRRCRRHLKEYGTS